MEIEQYVRGLSEEGEAEIGYTLTAGGREVMLSSLGAAVVSNAAPALPFPAAASKVNWESRVETDWVVMAVDLADGTHCEAGFYLDDAGRLEITCVTALPGREPLQVVVRE